MTLSNNYFTYAKQKFRDKNGKSLLTHLPQTIISVPIGIISKKVKLNIQFWDQLYCYRQWGKPIRGLHCSVKSTKSYWGSTKRVCSTTGVTRPDKHCELNVFMQRKRNIQESTPVTRWNILTSERHLLVSYLSCWSVVLHSLVSWFFTTSANKPERRSPIVSTITHYWIM